MATIRDCLDELGFDWEHGKIVLQVWGRQKSMSSELIAHDNAVLDGVLDCFDAPSLIAEDRERIYRTTTSAYESSIQMVAIFKDVTKYLDVTNHIPGL